jgi:hypothetical protein
LAAASVPRLPIGIIGAMAAEQREKSHGLPC